MNAPDSLTSDQKVRPILFSAPMVRALLAGTKTQTRREVKRCGLWESTGGDGMRPMPEACPYGKAGDALWVRETWAQRGQMQAAIYKADEERSLGAYGAVRWTPSIHMPRWASRIMLYITGIRVEHLQSITLIDAKAEGVSYEKGYTDPRDAYRVLWESINGRGS